MKQVITMLVLFPLFSFAQHASLNECISKIGKQKNISIDYSQHSIAHNGDEHHMVLHLETLVDRQYLDNKDYTMVGTKNTYVYLDHQKKEMIYAPPSYGMQTSPNIFNQYVEMIRKLAKEGKVKSTSNGNLVEFQIDGLESIGIEQYTIIINQATNFYDSITIHCTDVHPIKIMNIKVLNKTEIHKLTKEIDDFVLINEGNYKPQELYSDYNLNRNGL